MAQIGLNPTGSYLTVMDKAAKRKDLKRDVLARMKDSRPFQSCAFIIGLCILCSAIYFLAPAYYIESSEATAQGKIYYNGTFDFKGDPMSGSGDIGLKERLGENLDGSWYVNSRLFIIAGLISAIAVFIFIAVLILMAQRSGTWSSLLIPMGFIPPTICLLGCFRHFGDHLSFIDLNSVYSSIGLDQGMFVMFPTIYLVAFIQFLILGTLWYLYKVQTRPVKGDFQ